MQFGQWAGIAPRLAPSWISPPFRTAPGGAVFSFNAEHATQNTQRRTQKKERTWE